MYIYIYIYVCICICVCIYIYIYMKYTDICICIRICVFRQPLIEGGEGFGRLPAGVHNITSHCKQHMTYYDIYSILLCSIL